MEYTRYKSLFTLLTWKQIDSSFHIFQQAKQVLWCQVLAAIYLSTHEALLYEFLVDCTEREIFGIKQRFCIPWKETLHRDKSDAALIESIENSEKLIFPINLSKFSVFSMQRLITLNRTSVFMECKFAALSPKFLSVQKRFDNWGSISLQGVAATESTSHFISTNDEARYALTRALVEPRTNKLIYLQGREK